MECYDEIYKRMKERYEELGEMKLDEASDIAIRLKVLAGEIFAQGVNLEFIKSQMFSNTAIGKYLEYLAMERGIERKQAGKSKGACVFGTDSPLLYDVTIPKGTVVSTGGDNPIQFVTLENAVMVAGQVRVSVDCESKNGGKNANVKANTVVVPVTLPSGISSVSNPKGFLGGFDAESDDELRKRVEDSFIFLSNGSNSAYYRKLALGVEGVYSVGVIPCNRGNGTCDVFINAKGEVATDELIEKVQAVMDINREINLDVLVLGAKKWNYSLALTLSVEDGYDFGTIEALCREALTEYAKEIKVGENVYIQRFADKIFHIEGIKNFVFGTSDKTVEKDTFACMTALNITRGT